MSTIDRPEEIEEDKELTPKEKIINALEVVGNTIQIEGNFYKIEVSDGFSGDLKSKIEYGLAKIGYRPFFASKGFTDKVKLVFLHILTTDTIEAEVVQAGASFNTEVYDKMYDQFKEEDPTTDMGSIYFRLSELVEDITYMTVNGSLFPVAKAKTTEEYLNRYHSKEVIANHNYLYNEYLDDPSGDQKLTIFGSNLVHATNETFAPERSWIEGDYMYIALRSHA